MDRLYKILNANNSLNNLLPQIIEVFVDYYGEENREHIETLFNNAILIGYQDEFELSNIIRDIQEEESKRLIKEILKDFNLPDDEVTANKYFDSSNTSLEYISISPVKTIASFLESYKLGPQTRFENLRKERYEAVANIIKDLSYEDFINGNISEEQKSYLPKYYKENLDGWISSSDFDERYEYQKKEALDKLQAINPEINEGNIDEHANSGKLDIFISLNGELLKKKDIFDKYCEDNLSQFINLSDKQDELKKDLDLKYYSKLVEKYKHLLNEEDALAFDKQKQEKNPWFYRNKGLEIFLGTHLGYKGLIEYFDEKSDERLADPKVSKYFKQTIMEARIEYFKYQGIDLGDKYEDYVNNPKCNLLWPSKLFVSEIVNAAKEVEKEFKDEFYRSLPFYKDISNKLSSLNLLDKEELFGPENYIKKSTCVAPNIKQREDGYYLYPQILIYASNSEYLDVSIIHEFNHLYELALVNVKDGKYDLICGWDTLNGSYTPSVQSEDDKERRQYEWFNETINEMIAQDISSKMHEKGLYLFCDKDHFKDVGGTSYQRSFFLARDFYNEYKDVIIESRKNNNINIILDKVGKENFEQLNDLINEFYSIFPEFTLIKVIGDLKEGKDTELTRKYNEIKEKRDIILNNMRKYSRRPSIFNL